MQILDTGRTDNTSERDFASFDMHNQEERASTQVNTVKRVTRESKITEELQKQYSSYVAETYR